MTVTLKEVTQSDERTGVPLSASRLEGSTMTDRRSSRPPDRPTPTQRLLAVVLAIVASLAAFAVAASPASAASADPGAELDMLTSLNAERSSRGLHTLRATVDLVDVARRHAGWMADNGSLQHNGRLATDVAGWTMLSENVGYSGNPTTLHNALMNSTGHRANILDGRPTQVGVGAARDSRGVLWVTQVFRRPDASTVNAPTAVLGLGAAGTPDVAVASVGTLYTAERGSDGTTGVRLMTDSGFSGGATPLGGASLESPAIDATPKGQISVVARGTDRALWLRSKADSGSGWQPWLRLGGSGTSRPAVASWAQGRLDVVVRGGDGALWHRSQTSPGSWTGWMPLGGAIAEGTDADIVSTGFGKLTVAVQGRDSQIWARSFSLGSGWTPWTPLRGHSKGGPTLSSPGSGRVVVAMKGLDDAGWTMNLDGGRLGSWNRLGGVLKTAPTSAGSGGRVDVVTVGTDGLLYRVTQVDGRWSSWRRVS